MRDLGGGGSRPRATAPGYGSSQNKQRQGINDYRRTAAYQNEARRQMQALTAALGSRVGGAAYTPSGGYGGRYGGGGGGGYRRGGGGGYNPRAAEEARKKKQRQMVEELYKKQLAQVNKWQREVLKALPGYRDEALKQIAQVYAQNKAQTEAFRKQIISQANRANQGLDAQYQALLADLAGQGAAASGLQGALAQYMGDVRAAQGAGTDFNSRLAQVMATANADYRNMANAVHQAARAQARTQAQQTRNQLDVNKTQALIGLV